MNGFLAEIYERLTLKESMLNRIKLVAHRTFLTICQTIVFKFLISNLEFCEVSLKLNYLLSHVILQVLWMQATHCSAISGFFFCRDLIAVGPITIVSTNSL